MLNTHVLTKHESSQKYVYETDIKGKVEEEAIENSKWADNEIKEEEDAIQNSKGPDKQMIDKRISDSRHHVVGGYYV